MGDAKIWSNSLDPGCVCSPQDMIYYFSAKYFPAHKKQAALRDIYLLIIMKNLRDPKTKIYPSTTRGGKEIELNLKDY